MRRLVERALRSAGLALLLLTLWRVWAARDGVPARVVHAFDAVPAPEQRDRLAAAQRAGASIAWRGELPDLAAMAERAREPVDRWRLSVVGGGDVLVRDAIGPLDSLPSTGGTLITRTPREAWRVVSRGTTAAVTPVGEPSVRRVAVFGSVGWEAKFVIAALEEEGWGVDARLTLGPSPVVQGDPRVRLDRHAAVVLLDSALVDARTIRDFVRAGGGVVLVGDATAWSAPALRSIVPARTSRREEPHDREFTDDPLEALSARVFSSLRDDATPIALRERDTVVVARREGAGRVVQVGYYETWRWRMQGEEQSLREHRTWWSALVGAAAASPASPASPAASPARAVAEPHRELAAAPLAEFVQALGPATAVASATTPQGPALPRWVGLAILLVMLGEWASRRARGAA